MADNDEKGKGKPNQSNRDLNGYEDSHVFSSAISRRDEAVAPETIIQKEGPSKLAAKAAEQDRIAAQAEAQLRDLRRQQMAPTRRIQNFDPNNVNGATFIDIRSQEQQLREKYSLAVESSRQFDESKWDLIDIMRPIEASKANIQLSKAIQTKTRFGNVNTRTTTQAGSAAIGRMVKEDPSQMFRPTEEIESRNKQLIEQVETLGAEMSQKARGLDPDQEAEKSLKPYAAKISSIEQEIAFNKRLLRQQSRSGLSTEKLINRGEDLETGIDQFLKGKELKQQVDRGEVKSFKEEMADLQNIRNKRNKLQDQYNDAIEKGSKSAIEFAKKLSEANDQLDIQSRKVKHMSDKGMDQEGQRGKGIMQAVGYMGQKVANISENLLAGIVGSDIRQMRNRAAFAREGNRQYQLAEKAIFGEDVDAMIELTTSPQAEAAYAKENREITHVLKGAAIAGRGINNVISGGIQGASEGDILSSTIGLGKSGKARANFIAGPNGISKVSRIDMLKSLFTQVSPAKYLQMATGALGAIEGASASFPEAMDYVKGSIGADVTFQSTGGIRELQKQTRFIPTYEMQKFFNQGRSIYNNAQGLGNQVANQMSGSLMNTADGGALDQLAKSGIRASEAAAMLPMFQQAGALGDTDIIRAMTSAGQVAQRGIMGREDYLGAAARLTAAGASDKDLQDIITKGMENAKNINQMVDASIQMSAGLAQMGVSGAGAMQDALSAQVQGYMGLGINNNLATGTAVASLTNLSNRMKETGMNFGNIYELAQLRGISGLEGASVAQMEQLRGLGVEQIATLRGGGKQAQLLARRLGIDDLVMQDGKVNQGLLKQITRASLSGSLINTGTGIDRFNDILDTIESGGQLSSKDRAILAQMKTDEESLRTTMGVTRKGEKEPNSFESFISGFKKIMGAETDVTKAQKERGQIKGGKENIYGLDFEDIEKGFAAIADKTGKEFHDKVLGSAEAFRPMIMDFGVHVQNFGKIVGASKNLLKRAGSDETATLSKDEINGNEKVKSKEKNIQKTPSAGGNRLNNWM